MMYNILNSILNPTLEHAIMALVVLGGVIAHVAVTVWQRSDRRRIFLAAEQMNRLRER